MSLYTIAIKYANSKFKYISENFLVKKFSGKKANLKCSSDVCDYVRNEE